MKPTNLPNPFPFTPEYIFTDIDDTLTYHGQLPIESLQALIALKEKGITVVPVTGACSGWCDCLVRTWPVDTIIGENGALIMSMKDGFSVEYTTDDTLREERMKKLVSLTEAVLTNVPKAKLTKDSAYRATDIAFDIGQDQKLPHEDALKIIEICKEYGASVKMSSIHINVWYGEHSKATGAQLLLERMGVSPEKAIFIGDSPNDESMFELLDTTVGVANITPFLEKLSHKPKYIASKEGGLGFAEMASAILARD